MSWDRSRAIPWSRIRQDNGVNPEEHKEQVFREMEQEARREEEQSQQVSSVVDGDDSVAQKGIPFSGMAMAKQAAFGGCIGAITGSVFGFMDSMKVAGDSQVLKNASNMAKGKFVLQGTTRSAALFGAFFGGFHVIKYGARVAATPGEFAEIAIAAPIVLGGMMTQPALRPAMPYMSMLIIMDGVNIFMRNMDDD